MDAQFTWSDAELDALEKEPLLEKLKEVRPEWQKAQSAFALTSPGVTGGPGNQQYQDAQARLDRWEDRFVRTLRAARDSDDISVNDTLKTSALPLGRLRRMLDALDHPVVLRSILDET